MRSGKTWWVLALMLASMVFAGLALAHVADGGQTRVLQAQELADMPGKRGVVVLVSYAPGEASAPHRHPGSVFAYVLEGEVTSQFEGQPPVTYHAGQSWYEAPGVPHLVSRNASAAHPAKLLAWLLLDDGAPPKVLLPE